MQGNERKDVGRKKKDPKSLFSRKKEWTSDLISFSLNWGKRS